MKSLFTRLSFWEKALLVLVALYLALWPFESSVGFVYTLRVILEFAVYAIGSIVLIRLVYALLRVLIRRFLWRVRHRMAVAYVLAGVIPLTLLAAQGLVGVSLIFGPLAAFLVTSELEKRSEALFALADSHAWQLRAASAERRFEIGRQFVEDAAEVYPGVMVRYESPTATVAIPASFQQAGLPESLKNYRGVVRRSGKLYLSAFVHSNSTPSLLLMYPLSDEFLSDMIPGLGIVGRRETLGSPRQAGTRKASGRRERPIQAKLPPPIHPFDWAVPWPAQIPILEWESGDIRLENALTLLTRPSAVEGLLFRSQSAEFNTMAVTLSKTLALILGVLLCVSTVVAVSLSRTITSAIHDLHVGTLLVDQGDFSHRIAERGSSQLTELTRSFNSMTASIQRLVEDSKERERLEAELSIAQEVQTQLFPRSAPQIDRFEIVGVCRPARSVSGDFYDYVQLSDTRAAVSFGDVSGKGISAALVMAAVHSTIRTQLVGLDHLAGEAALREAVSGLVAETNRQLCAGTAADKFSTLVFGIYDAPTGAFAYTNAGHLPPLIVRGSETQELDISGMVVGAFPGPTYESSSVHLESGDLFAAFTDGVTEPENPYEQEFGEARFAELLVREADRPIDEIIKTVMDEVDNWTDTPELQDDMTMLLARRL